MLQISCILVTRPISIRPKRSAHIVGAVVDAVVDAAAESKVDERSGPIIIDTGIEMIM